MTTEVGGVREGEGLGKERKGGKRRGEEGGGAESGGGGEERERLQRGRRRDLEMRGPPTPHT